MKSLLISIMALALCRATGSENDNGGGAQEGTGTGNTAGSATGTQGPTAGPATTNVENFAQGNGYGNQGPTKDADLQKNMQQTGTADGSGNLNAANEEAEGYQTTQKSEGGA